MIELSKHIEILLLKHNCVIVPDLGGFIAQKVPARYIAEENLFLPPHRTVGFNPQLTINDGLLVQSYMQTYDTNYPDTVKLIEQAVSNLKAEIQERGEYELNGIGKIVLNIDDQYDFKPNEAGILSPTLYGLDSFSINPVEPNVTKDSFATNFHTKSNTEDSDERSYNFKINKEFVNYISAAVIAIFFYLLWATPITDSTTMNIQQASMLFPYQTQRVIENVPKCIPIGNISKLSSNQETTEIAQNSICKENLLAERPYTIVLISCIPLKNAEEFSESLRNEGFNDVSILNKRNIIRVVHGSYISESDAYNELRKLRRESNRFKDAWILNNK